MPLPDAKACGRILEDCLNGLGQTYPPIGKLVKSAEFERCAAECVGLDGRAIRKMLVRPRNPSRGSRYAHRTRLRPGAGRARAIARAEETSESAPA